MSAPLRIHHVLIVDDEQAALDLLKRRVERHGFEVSTAASAGAATAAIELRMPDIVLLDMNMPEVSGLEVLRWLRLAPATHAVPIIMVSAMDDTQSIVAALKEGANDYVTKPIDLDILLARMETQLRMASMLLTMQTQTSILSRLAAYDELTGIYNRRSLFGALESELSRSQRSSHPLSILMLDVDFFKKVNDTHGHLAGDEALKSIAARLGGALRAMDILGRYGGEEFCAILPESNLENALRTAERLRLSVADNPIQIAPELGIQVTISVGAATWPPGAIGGQTELVTRADNALFEAKRTGRNRVCHHLPENAP